MFGSYFRTLAALFQICFWGEPKKINYRQQHKTNTETNKTIGTKQTLKQTKQQLQQNKQNSNNNKKIRRIFFLFFLKQRKYWLLFFSGRTWLFLCLCGFCPFLIRTSRPGAVCGQPAVFHTPRGLAPFLACLVYSSAKPLLYSREYDRCSQ